MNEWRVPILVTSVPLSALAGALMIAGQWKGTVEIRIANLEEDVNSLKTIAAQAQTNTIVNATTLAEMRTTLEAVRAVLKETREDVRVIRDTKEHNK